MDVFRGSVPGRFFSTGHSQSKIGIVLAGLDWHPAFQFPISPCWFIDRTYSITKEKVIVGFGHYVAIETLTHSRRLNYNISLQVAAPTEEGVRRLRDKAKKAVESIVGLNYPEYQNLARDSIISPLLSPLQMQYFIF